MPLHADSTLGVVVSTVAVLSGASVLVVYFLKRRRDSALARCQFERDLTGRTCIVTGANCGLGFEVAKRLLDSNAVVILACRDVDKAHDARNRLLGAVKVNKNSQFNTNVMDKVRVMELDVSSLKSVEQFAHEFSMTYPTLDLLINNAGIMGHPYELSVDGVELHLATNYLGHYQLCALLQAKLNSESRVINVTSGYYTHVHDFAQLRDTNYRSLRAPSSYRPTRAYAASKAAQCLHTLHMGSHGVNAYAVRPGFVRGTHLGRHFHWALTTLAAPLIWYASRDVVQGSQTILHCAFAPLKLLKPGALYSDCAEQPYTSVVTDANADHWQAFSQVLLQEASASHNNASVRRSRTMSIDSQQ